MKNILILASANLRKNKGQTVSLLVFVFIAALLMDLGLVTALRIGSFYDEQAESSRAAHLTGIYADGSDAVEEGRLFMESQPDVAEIESVKALGSWGSYFLSGLESQSFLILSPVNEGQKIEPLTLIGEANPLTGDAIYLPYFMIQEGRYALGDQIKLNLSGTELSFTVAGATKEIMFGAQMNAYLRFYIAEDTWQVLAKQLPQDVLTLLSARLNRIQDSSPFQAAYNSNVSTEGLSWLTSYDTAKNGHIMIPLIAAAAIVAFALILLIVSMIVIRFSIINNIEDSMTAIGTQKAVGYRSVQIISAIALQFGFIAFAGGITGTAVSQVIIPMIMKVFEPIMGLSWKPAFDMPALLLSLATVLAAVITVSFISAQKINRLHPLAALRGGVNTHNFSKNRVPLDKTRGPLNLLLALKQVLHNKKQTTAVSLIVAAVTMTSVIGITFNYNLNDRRMEFTRSIFGEVPYLDINVMLKEGTDGEAFKERLVKQPQVRKAFGFLMSGPSLLINQISTTLIVAEDCSLMESNMLIEGRYPKHDNEVALGVLVSKSTGCKSGDTVILESNGSQIEYLVTGVIQTTEGNGFNGLINADGLRQLQPAFGFTEYAVYLQDGVDTEQFIETLMASEGDIFESLINEQNQINALLDSINGIFTVVTSGIFGSALFIISLMLYMVIKTTILRRKRDLGIQKALGFTTFQLMNQIALNMTPMILLGAVLGTGAGYFGASPVIAMFFSGMGILKLQLFIPAGQTVIVGILLVLFAYAISMLISWKIRKISAYALVSE